MSDRSVRVIPGHDSGGTPMHRKHLAAAVLLAATLTGALAPVAAARP
ncbi:hypothetical protein OG379_04735 [Streptomyces sp. NBC_01166]|nr:hypothetical protein OG379_04735 [Streptomyces sp. NBC_01166]